MRAACSALAVRDLQRELRSPSFLTSFLTPLSTRALRNASHLKNASGPADAGKLKKAG
ncbi:UNVERIFIED_ORG: hypothetical protein GGR68_001740 [Xanthomonas campestris]